MDKADLEDLLYVERWMKARSNKMDAPPGDGSICENLIAKGLLEHGPIVDGMAEYRPTPAGEDLLYKNG